MAGQVEFADDRRFETAIADRGQWHRSVFPDRWFRRSDELGLELPRSEAEVRSWALINIEQDRRQGFGIVGRDAARRRQHLHARRRASP